MLCFLWNQDVGCHWIGAVICDGCTNNGTLSSTDTSSDKILTSAHCQVSLMMGPWEPTIIMLACESSLLEFPSCLPSPSAEILIWWPRYLFGNWALPSSKQSFKWGGHADDIHVFTLFPTLVKLWLFFTIDWSWWAASIATILSVSISPWVMDAVAPMESPDAVTCVSMQVDIKVTSLLDSSSEISLSFLILLRSPLTTLATWNFYLLGLVIPFPLPLLLTWPRFYWSVFLLLSSLEK